MREINTELTKEKVSGILNLLDGMTCAEVRSILDQVGWAIGDYPIATLNVTPRTSR